MDLFMQVTVNAREREIDDWAELDEATVVDVGHLNIKIPILVIIIG